MLIQNNSDAEKRFKFGLNWKDYLKSINESRILVAEQSLISKLGSVEGKTFLDIGSGSGLFSLAASRLGAKVVSFDYDSESVECTKHLKKISEVDDRSWQVRSGSILDEEFIRSLGTFDIVYSWGVLHHTGEMWSALENACALKNDQGKLFIALYNDQGFRSRFWLRIKRLYVSGILGRYLVNATFIPFFFIQNAIFSIVTRRNIFRDYRSKRGMSIIHDWIDWLGGYPFEVAPPGDVVDFLLQRQLYLHSIKVNCGHGCTEYVFAPAKHTV